jgi:hypothetical protein
MKASRSLALAALVLLLTAGTPTSNPKNATAWQISGDLAEACTCDPPCTCNFGRDPSPHKFCYAIYSVDIEKGRYGDVRLDGLHLAGGSAAKGNLWYIDERANATQESALKAIATQMHEKVLAYWRSIDPKIVEDPQFQNLGFRRAKITQSAGPLSNSLAIGDAGSFESDYIVGIDGKTPVVVENNWSWNIQHGIKGKTRQLRYKDEFGNQFEAQNSNANQGKVDWSDKTPLYFR